MELLLSLYVVVRRQNVCCLFALFAPLGWISLCWVSLVLQILAAKQHGKVAFVQRRGGTSEFRPPAFEPLGIVLELGLEPKP